MRKLALLACSFLLVGVLAGAAGADEPEAGNLSVERGKGVVMLDLRGSTLGRLGGGTLTVTDLTPRDRFTATVTARKMTWVRPLGPKTMRYRGQGLRFRMVGGRYRMVVHGSGIALSAVGKGVVVLDAERIAPVEDAGVYSLEQGVDCSLAPGLCTPLPDEPERYVIGVGGTP
jgi:hypothetical protein